MKNNDGPPLPHGMRKTTSALTPNDLAHDLRNARPIDIARQRVEDLAEKAKAWAETDLDDHDIAARGADYYAQLRAERQRIEDDRKTEKRYWLDGEKTVDLAAAKLSDPLEKPYELMTEKILQLLKAERTAGIAQPSLRGYYATRAIGLRTIKSAKVLDPVVCAAVFADHPDVVAVLTKLASEKARAGAKEIPGCDIVEKEVLT